MSPCRRMSSGDTIARRVPSLTMNGATYQTHVRCHYYNAIVVCRCCVLVQIETCSVLFLFGAPSSLSTTTHAHTVN